MTTERNPQGYTEGPWLVEEGHIQLDSGGIRYWQVTDGQDVIACNQFCYANFNPETSEANARLIASAPELLTALQGLLAVHDMTQSPAGDRIAAWSGAVNAARAAISKATAPVKAGA